MKLATLPATGRWRQQEAISPKREHFGGGTQGQLFQRLRGQYQVQSRSLSHLERPSTTGGRGGGDAAATDVLRFLRTTSTQQRELRPGTGHQQRFTLRRRFSSGGRILGQQSLPSGDGIALSSRRRFSLPDENVDSGLVQRGRRSAQMEDSADSSMSGTSIPTTLSDSGICAGISALQGRRPYMEDESRIIPFLESDILGQSPYDSRLATHFFGVFDGHAGGRCSKSIAQLLPMNVAREGSFRADPVAAIRRGFFKTNLEFLRKADRIQANDGSTAITAFIRGRSLWVANVGDSRAVLVRGFPSANAIPLSVDHKPNRPEERRRIAEAGGRVVYMFGVPRVNGILAVSRAFGDRNMQGAIDAEPEIKHYNLSHEDHFLILATDGVWDTVSSQHAASLVSSNAALGAQACAELLVMTALRKGSLDNATAMVIDLRNYRCASAEKHMSVQSGESEMGSSVTRRSAGGCRSRGSASYFFDRSRSQQQYYGTTTTSTSLLVRHSSN